MVLITRNQEWNVARLVQSVLREADTTGGADVVLVDSNSNDRTAEIAASYPVRVLRLRGDQPLSPAAGRYVGFHEVTGDSVLFLDGDMELCAGWLGPALAAMRAEPDIGGLTGPLLEGPLGTAVEPPNRAAEPRELRHSGGAVLHRRSALARVGPFNPYLRSDEEPELCLRLRHAGFRIVELPDPIARHYSELDTRLPTLFKRWRRGLYLGAGQSIRHQLHGPLLWPYVRERGFGLVPGAALLSGAAAILVARVTGQRSLQRAWLALVGTLLAADAYRKRSSARTLHSLVLRLLILEGTIRGFAERPRDPAEYPARFEVVEGSRPSKDEPASA